MRKGLKISIISFSLLAQIVLCGCHTIRGVGQDIESGGEHIQKSTY
jgi:predicted small secreted protein